MQQLFLKHVCSCMGAGGGSASSNYGMWGGRVGVPQHGSSPVAGRTHRDSCSLHHSNSRGGFSGSARDVATNLTPHRSDGSDDSSIVSDGGVIGAALKCTGLGRTVPHVLAWLAKCRAVCREQWCTATHAVHRAWGILDARLGWRLVQGVETAHRAAALLNFLAFLAGGKYRSLLERLVGARLVYKQPSMARVISFEYLNRQLVWHEISELLLLLLPLLDAAKFRCGLG
ncbi:Pex12 amino terminal region-domain-containing protein [Dunaliella salina]|uniref:RING-type E3 ubiquitin transferase (cysteine targeting) n=1 Tax=Dunaliella salina TaxID=3046 RepID=A0ABQ7FY90_DUNSA|nr:Pex12 amino terminal region-domain-containing protein [Dunaliella salina]|eukprot:KAF5827318.1 Pex12 amino terminal region-domain-containing protein [Dunaliella salina]